MIVPYCAPHEAVPSDEVCFTTPSFTTIEALQLLRPPAPKPLLALLITSLPLP